MNDTFRNISKIIERDKKNSTYKFALLRGTIEIISDNSPFILVQNNLVEIPLGLLIEKWMIYYYPFFEAEIKIPQIKIHQIVGENTNIKFQQIFIPIIKHYEKHNGLSGFYNDLRVKGISKIVNVEFYELVKELKNNIVKNPMQYIGNSINKELYSIYKYQNNSTLRNSNSQNSNWLISSCGTFTIPKNYYDAFQILGSFISGTDNILFKWVEFSVNASNKKLSTEKILTEILKNPITDRDVKSSKKLYKSILKKQGDIHCVWTGKKITTYNVDHLIPFSVWKNNDLWNLLPSNDKINNSKKDKIPNTNILNAQKDEIIGYWELIRSAYQERFDNELKVTLLGNLDLDNWQNNAFNQLLNTSKYLIETRGFEQWKM
jgi:hypothetical protein